MAIYDGDQQQTTSLVVNGAHVSATPAQVKAAATPAVTAYRFTASFALNHLGSAAPLHYRRGSSYLLDPVTRAALLAASAPMIAL